MNGPTLRGQLTLASLLTTMVALLLTAGSLLLFELATYREEWVDDLKTQAQLIAHSTSAALVFNDAKAADENLQLLEIRPVIRAAAIYRREGHLFAAYRSGPAETLPAGSDSAVIASDQRFEGSVLEVTYPIERDGEWVGTVYLRAEHNVWDRLLGYLAILGAVTAISLALAGLVFGRLQRIVTGPLSKVSGVAHQVISHRDWTLRAPETRIRDLSVLVDAFNRMLAEVETATGELERETVERRQAQESLTLADRRKDEFLATLAHELRNPLAPMMNAVALLRLPNGNRGIREKAAAILDRQLQHMVRLIDDLLDVSRVATGKLSLNRETVDLVAVLHAAAELAEPLIHDRGLRFSVRVPGQPCLLVADSARLLQVFSNLLSNASRYTEPGGLVELEMATRSGKAEVTVRDTGIGIDPSVQGRIFELFEQADKTLERGNTGLGIGLTLARQLVQLHGGDIELFSEGIGHGASFAVRLPLPLRPPQSADSAPKLAPSPTLSLRLVLADDNVDFAASLQVLLESLGHRAVVVNDGHAALRAVAAERPDIAILDIGMPGLNGYEVARQLRADPATASVRLIAMTGWGQASDKQAAAQAGFDHHLVKPVAPADLITLLSAFEAEKTDATRP